MLFLFGEMLSMNKNNRRVVMMCYPKVGLLELSRL